MNAVHPLPVAASPHGAPHLPAIPQQAAQRGKRPANIRPDLRALPRGMAQHIEDMAGMARMALRSHLDEVKARLKKCSPGTLYYDEAALELELVEERYHRFCDYQSAARSRRMAPLSAEERAALAAARVGNPDIRGSALDALLATVPADPLDLAGLELDAAAAAFEKVVNAGRTGDDDRDEAAHGAAEARYLAAEEAYRRLLAERAGQDIKLIERRLSA